MANGDSSVAGGRLSAAMTRAWMIAAVAMVLLAGGCAVHGVRPSAPVESYPAVRFGSQSPPEETALLDSMVRRGYLSNIDTTLHLKWWMSEPHELLDSLVPGVRFLRLHWSTPEQRPVSRAFMFYRDTLYSPKQLNQVLAAAGYTFGDAEQFALAKLAVLIYQFNNIARSQRDVYLNPESAFPAVAHQSLAHEVKVDSASQYTRQGVWVRCLVDGAQEEYFVEFQRGQLSVVTNRAGQPLQYFDLVRPSSLGE